MLFDPAQNEVPDDEVVRVLRDLLAHAGRLPHSLELFLAGICAEHLVEGLHIAGLRVVRPVQWPLHE